jgi:hypothetical protein
MPKELYGELTLLARRKKASTAWIIRDAAEKYIANSDTVFKEQKIRS